ncbi:hypothetical protein F4677DRAFT_430553 [Hypoxylon crocopeplum]|nr:hypothetical protein F4677DRAFT_430553 [Hypoxylon crocopeplum]
MATGDSSDSNNIFVRFKNRVDNNIQRFQTVWGSLLTIGTQDKKELPVSNTDPDFGASVYEFKPTVLFLKRPNPEKGTVSAEDVLTWAIYNPYSPSNLQYIRQPYPNDAPRDYPDCFTFRDAFEDLLAVNSGQQLSDLRKLIFAKHFEHVRHFPWGLTVEDWVINLGRRDLWSAFFPLSSSTKQKLSYRLHIPLNIGGHIDFATFRRPQGLLNPSDPFWNYSRSRDFHLERHSLWRRRNEESSDSTTGTTDREALSDADLYAATQSDFSTPFRARIDAARGELNAKTESTRNTGSPGSEDASVSQTVESPDGGKILITVRQRTLGGGTEATTTTRRLNDQGYLVAYREETTRTWVGRLYNNDGEGTASDDEADTKSTAPRDGKSSGWFWTR